MTIGNGNAWGSILIVENRATARAMEKLLQTEGNTVATAQTVAQARRLLQAATFNLVIADISLPDGDGVEMLTVLKLKSPTKAIILSGFDKHVYADLMAQGVSTRGGDDDDEEADADDGILGNGDELNIALQAASVFTSDTSEANGSSIAVIAEFAGKRCLLAGDVYAGDLAESLRFLADPQPVKIDLLPEDIGLKIVL